MVQPFTGYRATLTNRFRGFSHATGRQPLKQSLCTLLTCWLPVLFSALVCAAGEEPEKRLRLYNWQDYMPQAVLEGFQHKTGYRVEVVAYETDDLKDELIMQSGGEGLDLIIGSSHSLISYLERGDILESIAPYRIPNLEHLDNLWQEKFPRLNDYAVPYLWGTMGIAYRRDLVRGNISSWSHLLQPEEYLRGRIMMINDYRDCLAAAFKLLGYSVNETSTEAIRKAGDLLFQQKPYVKAYGYIDLSEKSELVQGTVWMTMAYNGDALALKEYSDNIAYAVPGEGSNIWVDYIAVMAKSRHKEAAIAFIDYLNEPQTAATVARQLNYATPNRGARALLPPEHLQNPLIYPTPATLEKSDIYQPLPGRIIRHYNNTFLNVLNQ